MSDLPVVVVGAGPAGLAAAAHLMEQGLEPLVLERGDRAGASVGEWSHVRLFSPWSELVDPAAARLLEPTGWTSPEPAGCPTGAQWRESYLVPLALAMGARVRLGVTVTGVARKGRDLVVDAGRDTEPLTVHVVRADGVEELVTARALVDASGSWTGPNPLGGDGLPALGERATRARIAYQVPDLEDADVRARYVGCHVVVAGSGHSALTALIALVDLAEAEPGTRISWILRRGSTGNVFGGGETDELPARGALGVRAQAAVEAGHVRIVRGFRTQAVQVEADGLLLVSDAGERVEEVDEVVVLTGFRPDLSWLSELRLDLDPVLQAPTALAPLIDPNVHSCGTVSPHGAAELAHPETGVYMVGMKSYGRAPTFLAMTGYVQVRSVAAKLAGDDEAAARVELTLPDTGVCGGAGIFDDADASSSGGCCAPPAADVAPAGSSQLIPLLGAVSGR